MKLFYFQTCSTTSSQALDTGTLRISLFDPPFTILHGLLYYNSLVCLLYPENCKTRGLTAVFQFKNTLVTQPIVCHFRRLWREKTAVTDSYENQKLKNEKYFLNVITYQCLWFSILRYFDKIILIRPDPILQNTYKIFPKTDPTCPHTFRFQPGQDKNFKNNRKITGKQAFFQLVSRKNCTQKCVNSPYVATKRRHFRLTMLVTTLLYLPSL